VIPAAPQSLVVGVADCQVSNNPSAQIVTYALGSCLGVCVYDSVNRVGGMLHMMLPDSTIHRATSDRPAMYADTGFPLLIDMMANAGAQTMRLQCKIFGGAQVLNADSYFRIGEKNIRAAESLAQQYNLRVLVWEVGGQVNRTIRFSMANGEVKVRVPNKEDFVL
jgi:chemotaxis protein CheD